MIFTEEKNYGLGRCAGKVARSLFVDGQRTTYSVFFLEGAYLFTTKGLIEGKALPMS